MKVSLLFILSVILLSCKNEQPKTVTPFNFLLGDWERTNQPDGRVTKEHWKSISNFELRGHGYTLVGNDTAFSERMTLRRKDNEWSLSISGPNETPTDFEITKMDKSSFVAENPENEFPKKIKYSYFDDVLTAKISSDSTNISFIFWRIQN
ncbi:DUF6265 family protein [Dokdonia sp. Hel_I_53]|uniref:DUF6265 family protein n=1 Tax=Dokdonia sp. Hel_I_53 TaxID=1566287 RepID=UPI00119BD353|nr:DUF6265 family protein [Dokdonia sp. Hel_I_53]TVZ51131.1 hypothetical protein OD90_0267 [Dokdonia sp. Hel_I_53]